MKNNLFIALFLCIPAHAEAAQTAAQAIGLQALQAASTDKDILPPPSAPIPIRPSSNALTLYSIITYYGDQSPNVTPQHTPPTELALLTLK